MDYPTSDNVSSRKLRFIIKLKLILNHMVRSQYSSTPTLQYSSKFMQHDQVIGF
jgi:hypothetical protein